MTPAALLTLGALVLAIAFLTLPANGRRAEGSNRTPWPVVGSVFCLYVACVGALAMLLEYTLDVSAWTAIAAGVPLGVPALYLATKMA